jgi:glutamyl-tRNA synthetase
MYYRQQGFLPQALFNYLVRLGWSHGDQEVFGRDELINLFSLDHVGKTSAIFDIKKLAWLNGVYLRKLSAQQQLFDALERMEEGSVSVLQKLWPEGSLDELLKHYKERADTLRELYDVLVSLAEQPKSYNVTLIDKWLVPKTSQMLLKFAEELEKIDKKGETEMLLEMARAIVQAHEVKLVALAQPLRLALTGTIASPGVFELITILGAERSIERIHALLNALSS